MTMMLPEENVVIPRNVFAAASTMQSMVSNITLETYLDTDDESSLCDTTDGESSVQRKRTSNVLNHSQDILNILESIDIDYEEYKPEKKKLGKLYSTMPILQPVRKRSICKDGLGEMRNATFSRPSHSPKKPSPFDSILKSQTGQRSSKRSSKKPSPFDDIVRSSENQIRKDFEPRSSSKRETRRTRKLGSTRLTSKWDTSPTPPASNRRSSLRSSVMETKFESSPTPLASNRRSSLRSSVMMEWESPPPAPPVSISRSSAMMTKWESSPAPPASKSRSSLRSSGNQSMPILKPERKKSSEGLVQMRNATFSSLPTSKESSPFDVILQGNKPHVQRFSSLLASGSKPIAHATVRRTQSVLGTTTATRTTTTGGASSELGSAPALRGSAPCLDDKWESSPPSSSSRKKSTLSRSSNQSMPILKPVRKMSSEGLDEMRNATFTSAKGPLPTSSSSKATSRFDAILRGTNKNQPFLSLATAKKPSLFDTIVQSSEQRMLKLGHQQKSSKSASPFDAIVESQLGIVTPRRSMKGQQPQPYADITPKTSNARITESSLRRAQSVPHHVASSLEAKWGSSPNKSSKKNAVFLRLPKPVRRGSTDMTPLVEDDDHHQELRMGATKKKNPSPFDAIIRSSEKQIQLDLQNSSNQLNLKILAPKLSNSSKRTPECPPKTLVQPSLRRAQSVPVHVSDNTKWESLSPTPSNNKNAVFQSSSLNKPLRKGSADMMPKSVFETLGQRRMKRQQQHQQYSKTPTAALAGSSLIEASALDILLSMPARRSPTDTTSCMLLQRNQ